METWLNGVKLELWPLFQKEIGVQVEGVKKLTATAAAGPGMFTGAGGSGVKDSAVTAVIKRYVALFNSVIQLTTEEDEDMVFAS